MPTSLYDLVKGPQGDPEPQPYNVKYEDVARAAAEEDSPIARTVRTAASTIATELFTLASHGLQNGTTISFESISTVTGIAVDTTYYVVGATTNTFQVAATFGGAALALAGADGNVTFVTPAVKALVGTPLTPAHYFDQRDGAVTANPVLVLP